MKIENVEMICICVLVNIFRSMLDHPKVFYEEAGHRLDAMTLSAAAIAVADDRSVQPHHYNGTTCQSGLTGNAHNYQ